MIRSGMAHLPLHNGKAPRWLFKRMTKMAGLIVSAIEEEHGSREFLRRISEPYFFQAFGCAIGFDWHSSGLTTTVCGAIKEGTKGKDVKGKEAGKTGAVGIQVCGGKGKASKETLTEIGLNKLELADEDIQNLKYSSKMSAKVDNCLLQDGYALYHHCLFFDEHANWAVVQQGMSDNGYARRYHWIGDTQIGNTQIGDTLQSFISDPRTAACGIAHDNVLDMSSSGSRDVQKSSVDLVNDNPKKLRKYFSRGQTCLQEFEEFTAGFSNFSMPRKHWINPTDLPQMTQIPRSSQMLKSPQMTQMPEKCWHALEHAYELQPQSYEQLVALQGIGGKTVRALALVSELIYGAEASWHDPVKYSFAVGGKDGTPYPVDRKAYDEAITFVGTALESAEAHTDADAKCKKEALKKLAKLNITY